MRNKLLSSVWAAALSLGVVELSLAPALADTCTVSLPGRQFTPLTDFQPGQRYLGQYSGFLYSNGTNIAPVGHQSDGQDFASHIVPRAAGGQQDDTNGKIVFLSLGFSNNTIEFCGADDFYNNDPDDPMATKCPAPQALVHQNTACDYSVPNCPYNQPESFMGQSFTENRSPQHDGKIWEADGAKGSVTLDNWDPKTETGQTCQVGQLCYAEYDRVRDQVLGPAGLTEAQVQSVWFKSADADPTISLPDAHADAIVAEQHLGNIMRAIRTRYPNARQVFITPRTYGGYAYVTNNPLNPEPYAYEIGFSIRWLVDAQIQEIQNPGFIDANAGDLRYNQGVSSQSTWIDWGPYIWADGHNCKPGFACLNTDFRGTGNWAPPGQQKMLRPNECTHPGTAGEQKVGKQLLDFVNGSQYTNWFRIH